MESKPFSVPNMSCAHCAHSIERAVLGLKGVNLVTADESTQQVTVQWASPASWSGIKEVLTTIDYPPTE